MPRVAAQMLPVQMEYPKYRDLLHNGDVDMVFYFESGEAPCHTSLFPSITAATFWYAFDAEEDFSKPHRVVKDDELGVPQPYQVVWTEDLSFPAMLESPDAAIESPVFHFLAPSNPDPTGFLEQFMGYRMDLPNLYCASGPSRNLQLEQWENSPVTITFYAIANEAGAEMRVNLANVDGEGDAWVSPPISLTTEWEPYAVTADLSDPIYDPDQDGIWDLDFRIGLFQGTAENPTQAKVDNIRVTDELEWDDPPPGGPAAYSIDDRGIFRKDGEPYLPRVAFLSWHFSTLDQLHDHFDRLANDMGFDAVVVHGGVNGTSYASPRELQVYLDVAKCYGLSVVPYVQAFPHGGSANVKWPSHKVYAQSYFETFGNHPALLAWLACDELSKADFNTRTQDQQILKWLRQAEETIGGGFHPLIGITGDSALDGGELDDPWEERSPQEWVAKLARAVDIVSPNIFPIGRTDCASPLNRQIALETLLSRSVFELCGSQQDGGLCETIVPGVPEDCLDEAQNYCWSPKAVWPMMQLAPGKANMRHPWPVEMDLMGSEAIGRGASGLMYFRTFPALSTGTCIDDVDCPNRLKCADPDGPWITCGQVGDQSNDCYAWDLTNDTQVDLWTNTCMPGNNCYINGPAFRDSLPSINARMTGLHGEYANAIETDGVQSEWLIDTFAEAQHADMVDTYVHQGQHIRSFGAETQIRIGHNTEADLPADEAVYRALIKFPVLAMAEDDLVKAELWLRIDAQIAENIPLTAAALQAAQEDSTLNLVSMMGTAQISVGAVPEGIVWDDLATWQLLETDWPVDPTPDLHLDRSAALRTARVTEPSQGDGVLDIGLQFVAVDITDIYFDWIRGTDPVTNNGLFIDQEPGVVDFTLSVIAPSSENATAQLFDPLSIPNIRLVTRIGGSQEEQRSQPMRVALEADGRDAEIFVTEDRCPQGYGHAVVTDWGMPCSDGLRLVLSDVDATKMVQVFGTTGAYLGALPFIAAESCAETSPADLCGCIDPQDFDPEVWRVDVPMRYTAPYPGDVAILAFPRP